MLGAATPHTTYRWWRFIVYALVGVVTGLFSSWYIYGNLWSWPVPVLVALFVMGAVLDKRRVESP